ncbi:uncharacterized protein Z518_05492 [Rhinocladiella mackenziei CBS 650.93]|uniref:Rhinocladiella mackenziei CBS 650.93 unplaced genomic scaffold supercont1.4, whole genome shotgun sequence n=1 Tax=Rhinocladiella mackenziei CBS 650.93 TaxID=1442369 RepID=A0A0D2FR02_9EURO|nr:uncharacterized protein Z518_05492 [Rhinocladiella mackenziei CBS 650.93]KIX04622.1 hypothetical protein Z518_05492 [Rhinocladiella mackenziei CBS 650.93]
MKELQQNPSQHATRLALKEGFQKIEGCCRQASQEGLDWIWVDTCCIDKTSSSETSEAINSMFNWYRDSRVCYVYLADVTDGECLEDKDSTFRRSRWFTRGWTLQELLAPTDLLFFSKSWTFLEKRQTLCNIIEEITRIPSGFLGRKRLSEASIAQRMSWAARRTTTRKEDAAYCLLGIFDVNMPLLYGEGEKAFQRLQEEIIGQTDDQSIFAWESHQTEESDLNTAEIGALALSPSDFDGCGDIVQCEAWKPQHTMSFELTKKGLRIEMPLITRSIHHSEELFSVKQQILGLLNCRRSDDFLHLIAIPLGRPSVLFSDDQITSDGELLLSILTPYNPY